ncbi:MAG: hypothetical protein JXA75_06000 [Candidatus Thermoplasmatota archaeon]|nr:hypothetical protein [Candidatus Thermoplasmatota archaeon]
MRKKILGIVVCMLLVFATILSQGSDTTQENEIDYAMLYRNDAILPPESEKTTMTQGPDPGYYDLTEYMIGRVAIGIIFLESDGSVDPNTEDWTQQEKDAALGTLGLAGGYLQWVSWFNSENMNYHVLNIYAEINTITVGYEPITHPSGVTNDYWEKLYVAEALGKMGYSTGDWMQRNRDYLNYLRDTIETLPGYYGTEWAFTVFLVDNSNDADGLFSDGYHAYAYLGGPFTVCPHLVPGGPPGPTLNNVFAHEMGHIFYATDEYNGLTEYSGYLNQADVEGSGCIMDNLALCVSSGTKLQVGWRDTDSDGRADILDVEPETYLTAYTPDPTNDPTPTYTGSATVQTYPNTNPNGPGNDVTITFLGDVQFRVDGGSWQYATPDDGNWDEPVESYTFTTAPLADGTHLIESRAADCIGNYDSTPASDTLTIIGGNNPPTKPSKPSGPATGKPGTVYSYTTSSTDPESSPVAYGWDWNGDGTVDQWDDNNGNYYPSGFIISTSHSWSTKGTYTVKVKAKDMQGLEGPWSEPLSVTMPYAYTPPRLLLLQMFFERFPHAFPILRQVMGY